jgi:hypothetical protein
MIILPMGFQVYDAELADVISGALRENILCLAAPGDSGANRRVAFPARLPRVICIYSTDSYGNPSLFNPSPVAEQKNFSTLGEEVKSIWGDEIKYRSGTSVSLCVAGGILATMINLARSQLSMNESDLRSLNTPEGAEKIFDLMSSRRGGYDYVAPWLLLSKETFDGCRTEEERKMMLKSLILAALRQIR